MDRRTMLYGSLALLVTRALPAFAQERTVLLQPLHTNSFGRIDDPFVSAVERAVLDRYATGVRTLDPVRYTRNFDGDEALDFLAKQQRPEIVLGLVTVPLYVRWKGRITCISGYAWRSGNQGIITTYWRCQDKPLEEATLRFSDLALHELGHNFGASDCRDRQCTMYDNKHDPRPTPVLGNFCTRHATVLAPVLREK